MMERETWHVEIRCAGCRWATMVDPAGAASWLSAAGRLRSHSEATRHELRELAVALAPQIACTNCGQTRLTAMLIEDDPAAWPEARRCDDCGELIPPERLEVFPETRLCTHCQGRDDRGLTPDAVEYCPFCGSPMALRPRGGTGIHRYVMRCSANCRREL
ncbi:MAG TPA: TraR/DksA C4-type zinc finger protein [Pirellulales bacterium]|nr:TraR/DksA C4-type zinc finger protein [Pirellulales bacterium]